MREELPAAAEARVAGIRASGTWGSALTSGEFAAIRSVGFEPVGQVFGAAVFGIAYGDGYSCPRITASAREAAEVLETAEALETAETAETAEVKPSGQLSERGGSGLKGDGQGPGRVGLGLEHDVQGLERAGQGQEQDGLGLERAGQGQERDGLGPLGPLVRAMDQARRTAVERMAAQCAELGGDGVVGLRVSRGSFLLGGQEFSAIGTAVRARGAAYDAARGSAGSAGRRSACNAGREAAYDAARGSAGSAGRGAAYDAARGAADSAGRGAAGGAAETPRAPFTSDLSGQDFAKLIMAGWVPAGLVFGVAIGACHDDWQTTRQTRRWSGNREVAGWTEVVNQSRRDAGRRLRADVQRLGGEGAVLASMRLRVSVRDCPAQPGRRDHIIEASVLGTAIARFARADQGHGPASPALAVLPLVPPSRQSRDTGGIHPA
jgi:uncharacterized protein YbjQ (UPF0145 family)